MQFTRLLRNAAVTVAEMSRHAGAQTARRVAGREVVAIQDTSEVEARGRQARASGYGAIGKGGARRGVLLHPVLAAEVGSEGLLGLVSLQVWNRAQGKVGPRRARATAQKESQRWLDGMAQASMVLAAASCITMLCDREGDCYELFAQRPGNVQVIVRAGQNRRIAGREQADELLFESIDALPAVSQFTVPIPAAPGRTARVAQLAVRFAPVALRRPLHGADPALPATVDLTLVDVRELTRPTEGEPIHWRLLTSHDVATPDQARRIVDLYRMRWIIEEFFRTLKTAGFDIEAADISAPAAMVNFVAAATVAAVTVKQLVQARDGASKQRLSDAFAPEDQPVIEAISAQLAGKTARQCNPHPPGSLAFAAWVIARLGGWTGYYGKPGPKVMRIGLQEFHAIKYGTTLACHYV